MVKSNDCYKYQQTKGQGLELCKIDLSPPVLITDRSKGVLLILIFMLHVLSVCCAHRGVFDLLWSSCCFSCWALV